ncbi:MAG: hypothetical protein ACRENY_05950 [Candidatus Dormibacteria bacterium]
MSDPVQPRRVALEAAAAAFASAQAARRLLDGPGRRGAAAVNAAQPIPGARRASGKAQARMEESARRVEDARDRWAALMRGIAVDLDLAPELLSEIVQRHSLAVSLDLLEEALRACRDSAPGLAPSELTAWDAAQAVLQELRQADVSPE